MGRGNLDGSLFLGRGGGGGGGGKLDDCFIPLGGSGIIMVKA